MSKAGPEEKHRAASVHEVIGPSTSITDEHEQAMQRVLASGTFSRAFRLREFLKYIGSAAIAGTAENLNEQIIAADVFGRKHSTYQADDNIVRVTARQLRSKIDEYYQDEGKGERWRIDIPKGSYVPIFRPFIESQAGQPLETEPVSEPRLELVEVARRRGTTIVVTAVGVFLIVVIAVLWWQNRQLRTQVTTPATLINLMALPGQKIQIVTGDANVQLYRWLTGSRVNIGLYERRKFLLPENLPPQIPYGSQIWKYLNAQTIDFTNARALSRILASLSRAQVVVKHPAEAGRRDFTDGNSVLLSSPFTNPWVQIFEDTLNFKIEMDVKGPSVTEYIRNQSPQLNEPATYASRNLSPVQSVVYSRIALLPNFGGNGKILLLSGPSGSAVEAAGMAVCDPGLLSQLYGLFRVDRPGRLPWFEIVLEVVSSGDVPQDLRVVAHRQVARVRR